MRRFTLENEKGQKFDLNNVSTGFMTNPAGLGYAMSASYTKIGTVWTRNKFEDTQATITGDIVVATSDPYLSVQDFYRFVRESSELILHRITSAGDYLKNVDLTSVAVGELSDGGALKIQVSFTAKSLWYSKTAIQYRMSTGVTGHVKKYSFRYSSRYKDNLGGKVDINNDGSVPAPMVIVVNGPIINPVIKLKVEGVEMYSVAITEELEAGERIEWSSRDDNLYCELVSGSTRTNLVTTFDISNANFFKAPIGACQVSISADTTITAPVTLTLYKQYRAV